MRTRERPIFSAPKHRYGFLHPVPLKAGLAERKIGDKSYACQWYSLYEDADLKPARRKPAQPRAYTVPADGATDQWFFERASEIPSVPAFDVGFAPQPNSLYAAGLHVFLYHDDLPESDMGAACRGVLIGPGGRPVNAPLLTGQMLVPKDPLLPGGRYRTVATYSPTAACGTLQRTSSSSFTTRTRPAITELMKLGDPYLKDGRWYADTFVDELLRTGKGTITKDFDNQYGKYQYDLSDYWPGGRDPEALSDDYDGKMTYTLRNELVRLGSTCWSPTSVSRTYVKSASGVTAGPVTITRTTPDPCEAPPLPKAPSPATGSPGAIVRIDGSALESAIDVRFADTPANAWDADAGGLRVTVPAGAKSGIVTVRTPTGVATAGSFQVPPTDSARPDTRLDLAPTGAGEPSTAHIAFSSTEGRGRFTCRLDTGTVRPCASPVVREGLSPGVHTMVVTAIDDSGNVDRTPAATSWRVGPGAVPPQPVVPPGGDGSATRRPVLTVTTPRLSRRTGRLDVGTLRVGTRSRVRVSIAVTVGGRRVAVPAVTKTIAGGGRLTVGATLTQAARRLVTAGRRVPVTVTVSARSLATGKTTTLRRTLSVKAS